MSPKRLTRKEIKEDAIQDALTQVYDGLAKNTKVLMGVALALALVAAGVYAWQVFSSGRSDEIQQRFAEALDVYHAPLASEVSPDAEKPKIQFETAAERNGKALEAFSALAKDFSGTRVGAFSQYYVALVEHDMGQNDKATTDLEALIASSPEPEVAALARNALASFHLAAGETQQAIAVWKTMVDSPPQKFPVDGVLANLARAYEEVGDKEEALKLYRRLVAEFPQNSEARQFQSKVDFLEAELEASGKTVPEAPEPAAKESGA